MQCLIQRHFNTAFSYQVRVALVVTRISTAFQHEVQLVKKFSTLYGTGSFVTVVVIYILSQLSPVQALAHYYLRIRFNIIIPLTFVFPKWFIPFRIFDECSVRILIFFHAC
jgi:hypothetical protein